MSDLDGDRALVERCRAGDRTAFALVYDRHARRLFGVLSRMVGHRADAEDLLQDVFILAYRRLHTYAGTARLSTWLHRIAVNRALDHLRSRPLRMAARTESLDTPDLEAGGADPASASRSIVRLDLEQAITDLPDGYRTVFVLHDVEGWEHHEIAAQLGVAVGTSKSQLHKARLQLRRRLGRTVDASRPAVAVIGDTP